MSKGSVAQLALDAISSWWGEFCFLRLLVCGEQRLAVVLAVVQGGCRSFLLSLIIACENSATEPVCGKESCLGGFPLAGQPPEHYRVRSRGRAGRETPQAAAQERLRLAPNVRIGLSDILRVGDQIDLGDGLLPAQRAENTLRLFLGEQLYQQLEREHFLDVSSVCYAERERVYRLRRDPHKQCDRRVRVFEHGRYVNDFCIVRDQRVPEGDHWLTVFMQLLSDEQSALSVVKRGNIFPPHSDDYMGREEETTPAVWQPRVV